MKNFKEKLAENGVNVIERGKTVTYQHIAENKIVGMHRGKTEIGPRALCHRSIMANPANPNMKDILNSRVKHREEFRPFAPTVTQEDQFKYFDLKAPSEYMLLAPIVKDAYRTKLPSVTHVDNTARVQAISKEKDQRITWRKSNMKKFVSIALTMMLVLSLALTVCAAGEGSITINGGTVTATGGSVNPSQSATNLNRGNYQYCYGVQAETGNITVNGGTLTATGGNIDYGTLTGTGKYLKQQNPGLHIIAVEPASSPLLSGGKAGPHGLQGIGANFVPSILDTALYDEVMPVTEADAFAAARLLGKKEGLLCGISAGAALHAAMEAAKRPEYAGKRIVVILPDTGDRYLSTDLFE